MGDEQERRAEALDLQRAAQLARDAVPEPGRGDDQEREHPGGEHSGEPAARDQRLPPAFPPPDVDERERDDHARPQLCRDADAEESKPEPRPPAHERGHPARADRGRPEIEAGKHHGAQRERRQARKGEHAHRPRESGAQAAESERESDQAEASRDEHQGFEQPPVRVEARRRVPDRGRREHRKRAGRILDAEVPVGHLSGRDPVPVLDVDRRVDDLRLREEPAVKRSPRRDQEQETDDERRSGRRGLSRSGRARGARCHSAPAPPARAGARPAASASRPPRTGRTTGCRGRTSASARARSRR